MSEHITQIVAHSAPRVIIVNDERDYLRAHHPTLFRYWEMGRPLDRSDLLFNWALLLWFLLGLVGTVAGSSRP